MSSWDRSLFYAINHGSDSLAPILVPFSKGFDDWGKKLVLLLIVVALISRRQTRAGGIVAGFGWIVANGITDLLKLIPFSRPCNVLPDVMNRISQSSSMGTASAHSANMAFVATAFALYFRWWSLPWIAAALITGYSRVYVGAHFPSQVLLGWSVGVGTAFGLRELERVITRRRTNLQSDLHSQETESADHQP